MKVTFPHMGNMYIPVKALLEECGLEVIVPPFSSKKTLNLGVQNSPEFACLPLKINIGNFIEAHELGADTIIMAGGVGPCRFGYYANIQKDILKDLGLNYEMIVLEPPDVHYSEIIRKINKLTKSWRKVTKGLSMAWTKACAIDEIEMLVQKIRPRELVKGSADKVFDKYLREIEHEALKKNIKKIVHQTKEELNEIKIDKSYNPPQIAIVGEIYTVLEPFVNFNIEKQLGSLGVEVTRSIYLSQWINDHLFLGIMPMPGSKEAIKEAKPFINSFVGGHGRESVGSTVIYAKKAYNGVIQVAPFTCMPEIVAHSVMPNVSREYNIPTMTIYLDEQSGEAGLKTRLEAFTDLIHRQKPVAGVEKNNELLSWN